MNQSEFLHFDVTDKILGAVRRVHKELGRGFGREVYESALARELSKANVDVVRECQVRTKYDGVVIGRSRADMLVGNKVILNLTVRPRLDSSDAVELVNLLRASDFEVGMLVNFGHRLEFMRRVYSNSRKVRTPST